MQLVGTIKLHIQTYLPSFNSKNLNKCQINIQNILQHLAQSIRENLFKENFMRDNVFLPYLCAWNF